MIQLHIWNFSYKSQNFTEKSELQYFLVQEISYLLPYYIILLKSNFLIFIQQ